MQDGTQRKLAAIVAADVVGYSRLMATDETGTIDAVRKLRTEQVEPTVARYGGRVVKTMGDGFLIEFASVVAGVEAAAHLQGALQDVSENQPDDQRIMLRIGIHVGDIVFEGSDIFGDGVNIAARIEPLAAPGGISISDEAYRQVRDKLPLEWRDGGQHSVKNMSRPLHIWHWGDGPVPTSVVQEKELQLPDLPSVAVLPFDNMSSDAEQDYFADGMTEDLITDLSKISGVFVVARNSTNVFKGQAVDIPAVARKLGVANIIEGSVRKLGDQVRINVQLIDAASGGHLWADRYDGSMASVFELQDRVCSEVVSALSVSLTARETKHVHAVHTTNIEAYELFVRAKATPFPPIPARIEAARDLFQQVAKEAPSFAGGHAGVAWMIGFGALWGHSEPELLGARAEALAYKAITVDKSFGFSYAAMSLAMLAQRRFDEAVEFADKGVEYLPNDADAHVMRAIVNSMCGNECAALQSAEAAYRLSPNFVNGPYLNVICHTNFAAQNYEAAIDAFERNVARGGPIGPPAFCWGASSYHVTGQTEAANRLADQLLAGFPRFQLDGWNFLKLIRNEGDRERMVAQFRNAGVPFNKSS